MDLQDSELGDQYLIYIDSHNEISPDETDTTLSATVIAKGPAREVMLGWIKGQPAPRSFTRGIPDSSFKYVSNHMQYDCCRIVSITLSVASKVFSNTIRSIGNGIACSQCFEFYNYAVANQPNDKLICWSCRNR